MLVGLTCAFPGCVRKLKEDRAYLPALVLVAQKEGHCSVAELNEHECLRHVLCPRHSRLAQIQGVKTYPLGVSLRELVKRKLQAEEKWRAEEEKAAAFFASYNHREEKRPFNNQLATESKEPAEPATEPAN